MSVSLTGPDGGDVGGELAGFRVAAGPVQAIIISWIIKKGRKRTGGCGEFSSWSSAEQKPKKQLMEYIQSITTPTVVCTVYSEELIGTYGDTNPVDVPSSFQRSNVTSLKPIQNMRNISADNNGSMHDHNSSPNSD